MIDKSKLQRPKPPRGLIARTRLDGLLDLAAERPLTVLHAPAGFGKTTAVLNWLQGSAAPVAWLTLDPFDNDLRRLASHLFAALDAAVPGLGREALHAAEGGSDPLETCIPLLAGAVARMQPDGVRFVLDDFHVLTTVACQSLVRACVRTVMRSMPTIVTSRTRPPLRTRAGDISIITAGELSFRQDEAEQLLNGSYRLDLSETQLRKLEARVHGWPVGLSLLGATCMAQQQPGIETPIEEQLASLSRGALADYVIQEMLDQLEPAVRDFTLRTSILDRLCAELCEALFESPDTAELFEQVSTRSYVTIELGDDRTWVRSHDLVRSVLERKLLDEDPALASELHRRAAVWYAEHQLAAEAINHAIAAGDGLFAAQVIAANADALIHSRQYVTLRRALDAAPAERGELGPLLEALDINLTIWDDDGDYPAARVRASELAAGNPDRVDVLRICDNTLMSAFAGDVGGAVHDGWRALERDRDDPVLRPQREVQLGQALWFAHDFEASKRFMDPYVEMHRPLLLGIYSRGIRALIHAGDGELRVAEQMAREAIAMVIAAGAETAVEFLTLQAAVAEVLRAAGKLDEARRYADDYRRGRELVRPGGFGHGIGLTVDARIAMSERRYAQARDSAARARTVFSAYPDPGVTLLGWLDELDRTLAAPASQALPGTRPTAAEMRVLKLLADGLSRRQIAARLYVSDETVKSHLSRVYKRLGVSSGAAAIAIAHERGLI